MTADAPSAHGRTVRGLTLASGFFLAARVCGAGMGVVTSAVLARHLTPHGFGQFGLALAAIGVLTQVTDFGVTQATTARMSTAEGAYANSLLASAVALRTSALMLGAAGTLIAVWLLSNHDAAVVLTAVVAAAPLAGAAAVTAATNARLRPELAASVVLAQSVLWLAAVIFGASTHRSTLWFAIAFSAIAGAQFCATLLTAKGMFRWTRPQWEIVRALLAASWPIGILGIVVTAYYRLDSAILYAIKGPAMLGNYVAAYKFLDTVQLLPATLVVPLLPVITRMAGDLDRRGAAVFDLALRLALAIGIAGGGTLVVAAPALINAVYGADYSTAAASLAWLGLAFVGVSIGFVCTTVNVAVGATRRLLKPVAAIGAVSLLLHFAIIPHFAATGAAAITAVTELAVGAVSLRTVVAQTGWSLTRSRYLGIVVPAVVFPAAWLLPAGPSALRALAALAIFAVAVGATGGLGRHDWQRLLRREAV